MKPAIEVQGLSKVYNISHRQEAEYVTMRETIIGLVRKPLELITGQPVEREKFWALKDLTFKVNPGEVVGIIGHNGSGKSTLLKALSRIVDPTAGKIIMRGKVASLLEVGTGFHPELTGRENIYFNGAILGMGKKEIDRKFDEIVAFSEVEQFLDTPVKFYSSGMYVRLAFAVAAHLEPDILIVDEVLAVGDSAFQKKSLGKMNEVAHAGRTVLFVSHSMESVRALCQRVVLLEKGRIKAMGTPEEVIDIYFSAARGEAKSDYRYTTQTAKEAQITKIELRDNENKPNVVFPFNQPWKIRLEYVINTPIKGAMVSLEIISRDNVILYLSADTDTLPKLLDRSTGLYETTIGIREHLIVPGEYYLRFAIQVPGRTSYDVIDNIPIEIARNTNDLRDSYFGPGHYIGYLADISHWETQKK